MKKKLMAVAVAGALAAPALAFAQTSTVNIYGSINIDVVRMDQGTNANLGALTGDPNDQSTARGRPAAPNTRVKKLDLMSRYDTYLGFRGEEKLGGNLSAWFQCETTLDVTGEDMSTWCDRNSAVGLKGGWGNVFIGNWDTPFKIVHGGKYRPFSSAGIWGMRSLLFNENNSPADSNDIEVSPVQFNRRSLNSVNYHSPSWGGFSIMGQFTTLDETTDNVPGQVNGGVGVTGSLGPLKPRLWSVGAEYEAGPLSVGIAYEVHQDFNPGGLIRGVGIGSQYSGGDDRGWEISAAYTFGPFRLSGMFSELRYDVANGQDLKARGWAVFGDWRIMGPHRLRLEFAQARDVRGNSTSNVGSFAAPVAGGVARGDTGAKLYGINYGYAFSKRTEVVVGYAKLDNDTNARHRLQSSAARPGGADPDQDAWAVGIRHRF